MPESPYLFVYGTLRRSTGTEWSKYLRAASGFVGIGRTQGMLFQLDGYPGMTASTAAGAWVTGEVYLLHDSSSMLRSLGAYEGCDADDPLPHEFERHVVTVLLESGQAVEAWAYINILETEGKPRVTSGDYIQARPKERPTGASRPS